MIDLSSLNDAQKQAVETTEGPLMVIAGAGSGKTRVLTYRIAHLIDKGIDGFNILALTFTNKAAKEMKERIYHLVRNTDAHGLWMGTFHSIFARILRADATHLGYQPNFTIYDSQDSLTLVKGVIKALNLDAEAYKPKGVLARISMCKNNLITTKVYEDKPELVENDKQRKQPHFFTIYKTYVEQCLKNQAMDFDDLLLRTYELFVTKPEVLEKYRTRFQYIHVDEYQDTNLCQNLIINILSKNHQNICVVGDDAQSIYAFRGARIDNILDFKKNFKNAQSLKLEENYRSTQNIVNAANSLIKKNLKRLEKTVWTSNEEGEKIFIYKGADERDEAKFVSTTILDLKLRNQLTNSDFCVLYRTNAQSRNIEDALRKKNIKYVVYGGVSFYQRKEIKDLVAYLRLLVNPQDEQALLRVINYPTRGIGTTTVNKLIAYAEQKKISVLSLCCEIDKHTVPINQSIKTKVSRFGYIIKAAQAMLSKSEKLTDIVAYVYKQSGMRVHLGEDMSVEGISRVENVREFMVAVEDYEEEVEKNEETPKLEDFLENIALITATDQESEDEDERISLMTIHLSKGLEFKYVFVVGMEEGLFPSAISTYSRSEVEEERRLFYVAITRAEKRLWVSHAISRRMWGNMQTPEPSRFIDEIDEQYLHHITPPRDENAEPEVHEHAHVFNPIKNTRKRVVGITSPMKKISTHQMMGKTMTVGTLVKHHLFGEGRVVGLEKDKEDIRAEIEFGSGRKKMMLKFAKLEIL